MSRINYILRIAYITVSHTVCTHTRSKQPIVLSRLRVGKARFPSRCCGVRKCPCFDRHRLCLRWWRRCCCCRNNICINKSAEPRLAKRYYAKAKLVKTNVVKHDKTHFPEQFANDTFCSHQICENTLNRFRKQRNSQARNLCSKRTGSAKHRNNCKYMWLCLCARLSVSVCLCASLYASLCLFVVAPFLVLFLILFSLKLQSPPFFLLFLILSSLKLGAPPFSVLSELFPPSSFGLRHSLWRS